MGPVGTPFVIRKPEARGPPSLEPPPSLPSCSQAPCWAPLSSRPGLFLQVLGYTSCWEDLPIPAPVTIYPVPGALLPQGLGSGAWTQKLVESPGLGLPEAPVGAALGWGALAVGWGWRRRRRRFTGPDPLAAFFADLSISFSIRTSEAKRFRYGKYRKSRKEKEACRSVPIPRAPGRSRRPSPAQTAAPPGLGPGSSLSLCL